MNLFEQHELFNFLNYDKETGFFTWKKQMSKYKKINSIAGSKNKYGYIKIGINKNVYLAHRLAWIYTYGEIGNQQIDHINGNKSDNRIDNLRLASNQENRLNTKVYRTNKLGIKGVCKHGNNYRATCKFNKIFYHLGTFKTIELAKSAYENFCKKHHGEFYHAKAQ